MATRIDGFLNPTLFRAPGAASLSDPVLALGRREMGGGLAVCRVAPAVAHVAYVDQPAGHVLEDPRYLGAWGGAAAFICADAVESASARSTSTVSFIGRTASHFLAPRTPSDTARPSSGTRAPS